MSIAAYRLLGRAIAPGVGFWLKRRAKQGKEDPARAGERRGIAGRPRPAGRLYWFHAASVGEVVSVLPVIAALRRTRPEVSILLTSGTVTSATLAARRLPEGCLHQYVPADLPAWVDRFLAHWRPDAAFWVESELWPGLVVATRVRGVPMILLNARISERSVSRWRRLPALCRPVIGAFDLVLARSATDADRFRSLGASRVEAPGDLKLAALPLPVDTEESDAIRSLIGDRPVFLAASTHAGEEIAALKAHQATVAVVPDLLTVIVPRHPQRAREVRDLLESSAYGVAQRTDGDLIDAATAFYLADTLGELGLFYGLADVSFVGGSITPRGGQNPLEAAPFDTAILMGPDRRNNLRPAEVLEEAGALVPVKDAGDLAATVRDLFAAPGRLEALKERARSVVRDGEAVLDSTLEMISPYIEDAGPDTRGPDARGGS